MKKEKIDLYLTIGFLVFVGLCILYYLYWTIILNFDSIQSMAKLFTNIQGIIAAFINILFIIFISLTVAVFLHYVLFELRMGFFYKPQTRMKIAPGMLKTLQTKREEDLAAVKKLLEGDLTFFAESVRRLNIDHFSSQDTLVTFFRSIIDEEFVRVRRNLMFLGLTAVQAPALGFLGTAVGMVSCFYEIALKQFVTPGDLAQSIQFALITTVLGLIIKTIATLCQAVVIRMISQREQFILDRFDGIFFAMEEAAVNGADNK
jgi:biopolymer transport protein ExbB/TolQ